MAVVVGWRHFNLQTCDLFLVAEQMLPEKSANF